MSVTTNLPYAPFDGNGSTTYFEFESNVSSSAEVKIAYILIATGAKEADWTYGSEYTATGFGTNTLTITPATVLPSTHRILIYTDIALTQLNDYVNLDQFDGDQFEADLDKGIRIDQQLSRLSEQAVKIPVEELGNGVDISLPTKAQRASKALGFNASGELEPIEKSTVAASDAGSITYTSSAGTAGKDLEAKIQGLSLDVKADFGATGDGTTNDAAAIQAAIDACSYGERSLYFPAGEYYTGTTSLVVNGPIRIHGEGMGQAYSDGFGPLCTTIRYVGTDAAVKVSTGIGKQSLGFVLENIAISGYATGTASATGSYGLRLGSDTGSYIAAQGEVRNVRCEGFTVGGIHNINAQGVAFYNCRAMFNGDGLLQEGGASSGGGNRSNSFHHCLFNWNTKRGAYLKEGGNTVFRSCHFETNNWEGWHVERNAASGIYALSNFSFLQCHVEANQVSPNTGTAWATSTDYVRGDFVNESSVLYRCIADHTSGTFATDLSSGNWAAVEYCGQFLVDTKLNTGVGGARVFIDGGRPITNTPEVNGIRLNRLGVVNHGSVFIRHFFPNIFTQPLFATEAYDDNHSTVIRQEETYAPYIGSPTSQRPISGGGVVDMWTLPSAAELSALTGTEVSYDYLNTGTKERFNANNEDVFRAQASNIVNTFYGETRVNEGSLRFEEITDPSAPDANYGIVYCKDNGAGKTQLVVRFPTGAVQVLATEP